MALLHPLCEEHCKIEAIGNAEFLKRDLGGTLAVDLELQSLRMLGSWNKQSVDRENFRRTAVSLCALTIARTQGSRLVQVT